MPEIERRTEIWPVWPRLYSVAERLHSGSSELLSSLLSPSSSLRSQDLFGCKGIFKVVAQALSCSPLSSLLSPLSVPKAFRPDKIQTHSLSAAVLVLYWCFTALLRSAETCPVWRRHTRSSASPAAARLSQYLYFRTSTKVLLVLVSKHLAFRADSLSKPCRWYGATRQACR